ncbi:MAG: 2-oxoacid:acceptor oxidoreductase family protein [Acidobacteria bacterium]|nr:2-oxoacid:acceptor oxidoreductase family protein [Acidobacteriota bacterium]
MPELKVIHEKAECFYDVYERKGELSHQTHYCPGCGHGVMHKLLAEAIDELGIRDRVILVSPVGCSVFIYYYFDVGNVQVAHGRAPAVATALKRARPDSIVISYQGDGDLAAIGSAEILHAANRGENYTAIFVNNAIYGMTGGQMAPTTLIGNKTTTTPRGRNVFNDGYPLHVSEVLASLEAPAYIERVSLGNTKTILQAKRAMRKALETQMKGLGFSLVEVLSPCPTIWKMDPVDAQRHVREALAPVFPPGVKCDRTGERQPRPAQQPAPALADLPALLKLPSPGGSEAIAAPSATADYRVKIAGFGGQGVLLLGQLMAEAGMDDGLEVSWLPSYGPEMRSGTSNCHVRLSPHPVDSPLVSRPNVLIALNEPSLRKFIHSVDPGGLVLYNGDEFPEDCRRGDVDAHALPFASIADALGTPKVANIVVLGAFLAATGALPLHVVDHAMARVVKGEKWLAIDRLALAKGVELMQDRDRRNAGSPEVPCHA